MAGQNHRSEGLMTPKSRALESAHGVGPVWLELMILSALQGWTQSSVAFWACVKRTRRCTIWGASLNMSSLRTSKRQIVGWGYTNQTAEGQRKWGWESTTYTQKEHGRPDLG